MPIDVTLSGMVTDASVAHPENTPVPIVVIPDGKDAVTRESQLVNAPLPTLVMLKLFNSSIWSILLFAKALPSKDVTNAASSIVVYPSLAV